MMEPMAGFAWCTDIHLDFVQSDDRIVSFVESLCASDPAGIFITGDISTSETLMDHLGIIEHAAQRPVYLVLGNHDYYGSDVLSVRADVSKLCQASPHLGYLTPKPFVSLTEKTALVGHDGWYDALYGDPANSRFMMRDWCEIGDFVPASGGRGYMMGGCVKDRQAVIDVARRLATGAAEHVREQVTAAIEAGHRRIIVLTHVPPFEEAHVYAGRRSDATALPWYTSKLMGDMLTKAASTHETVEFDVLCGHTHGAYDGNVSPNMRVRVGGAGYGHPVLQAVIEVE